MRLNARSFAGGEITPELYGRFDLSKFQTGLALCRNLLILPHGPAARRPGFEYVLRAKDASVRIIEFSYNTEQTYVIELGNQYARFHTNGGTVLDTAKSVVSATNASPGVFEVTGHGWSVGQWVNAAAFTGMAVSGYFKIGTVPDVNHVTLTDLWGTALDTSALDAYTGSGTLSRVHEISTPFVTADLFDINYVQSADVMTLVHPEYAPRELRRTAANVFALSTVTFEPTISAPANLSVTATTGSGAVTYEYVVTAQSSTLEESLASTADSCTNDLSTAGNENTLTWDAVTGAVRYKVYKLDNGLYGYIGETPDTSFVDDIIEADVSLTPPEDVNPFTGADTYPGAASYYEQRRVFGASNDYPQNYWMTRSATESNMTRSIPTRDDDRIAGRIVARQVNRIRHFVPLDDLIVLTSGGAWKIGSTSGGALTPTTLVVRPQSFSGASKVIPQITDNAVLYVAAKQTRVRELAYSWEASAYKSANVSIMAPHLFDGYTLVDAAYTEIPEHIFWAVRSDGKLLGMTYVPEHDVRAWHQHDTDGAFLSVAAVSESGYDALYAAVSRTINGATVTYIERLHTRAFDALADWFGVDSGLTYSGSETSTISGLGHLEGETVSILGDGAVIAPKVVTGGQITLSTAVSTAHIGLPYTSDLQSLPVGVSPELQGRKKNIGNVHLRVYRTSGISMGPDTDHLRAYPLRTSEPYGSPPGLITDEITMGVDPSWNVNGQIFVRQTDPLPITVVAMTLEAEAGG